MLDMDNLGHKQDIIIGRSYILLIYHLPVSNAHICISWLNRIRPHPRAFGAKMKNDANHVATWCTCDRYNDTDWHAIIEPVGTKDNPCNYHYQKVIQLIKPSILEGRPIEATRKSATDKLNMKALRRTFNFLVHKIFNMICKF